MKQIRILVPLLAAVFSGGVFAATDYPTGWTKCVKADGTTCAMTGTHYLALGKSGSFVYSTVPVTGAFTCDLTASYWPTNSFTTSAYCSYNPADASGSSSSAASSTASSAASSAAASSAASSAAASSAAASSAAASSAVSYTGGGSAFSWAGSSAASVVDAKTLTGASTPMQNVSGSYTYGVRNYTVPAIVNKLHNPTNYKAVTVLSGASSVTNASGASVQTCTRAADGSSDTCTYRVNWQFATVDPTGGKLTFERATAPQNGWHTWSRKGKVIVTGGSAAASNRIYTVFNGQQLVAALAEAGIEPKIVRVVGHIDLRWSNNNTKFEEYTGYLDQKWGGSIYIPSNTTLVGINDAQGRAARITGTSFIVGGEARATDAQLTAACGKATVSVDAEADYKAWVACGKDGEDYPTWTRNIIIRNIALDTPWDVNPEDSANAYADGITLSRAQNVYFDHVSVSDGDTTDSLSGDTRHDGALDVVRGSDYVTIANSYFFQHHKTTLVGNGDSGRAWSDDGRMHVTFYGNFWDRVESRLPLNRYGQVHMFNNYIYGRTDSAAPDDQKFGSGVDPRYKSNMLVQNMFFEITELSSDSFCGKGIDDGNTSVVIGFRSSGHLMLSNKKVNNVANTTPVDWSGQCGYAEPTGANLWNPPYAYSVKATADVKASTMANAGAGKLK